MDKEPISYAIIPTIWEYCLVVQIVRIGQRYIEPFNDGVMFPKYVYSIEQIHEAKDENEAKAFLHGIMHINQQREDTETSIHSFKHPTFTSSIGGPGKFELDPNGGPLFTLVNDQ